MSIVERLASLPKEDMRYVLRHIRVLRRCTGLEMEEAAGASFNIVVDTRKGKGVDILKSEIDSKVRASDDLI